MDRRKFLALVSSTAAVGGAKGASLAEPRARREAAVTPRDPSRPLNVVLMICDDIGFGDVGCYGSQLPTPNLDRMAREGTRFTRFNGGHPLCSASRAALLTGRYGTRMHTVGAFGPHAKNGTDLDETLMSNLFKNTGYRTAAIGKWHLGDDVPYLPTSRGFDSYFGLNWSVDMHPVPLMRDTTVIEENTDCSLLIPKYRDEAVKFLESKSDKPFFLYLGFPYPHWPPQASPRFKGKSGFGNQGDAIAEIDWCVGELMHTVEKMGRGGDTLFLFTGDHGPWGQGNPGMLRGRKASTWEGGFRVPMIARLPGAVPAGQVCDTPTSNLDVLPTLATMCGLGKPGQPLTAKPLDGVDASSLYLGTEKAGTGKPMEERARIYFSPMSHDGLAPHCLRKGDWKLRVAQATLGEIYINDAFTGARESAWLGVPELYNVRTDPAESYNVANMHPEMVATMSKELDELMGTFPPEVQEAYAGLKNKPGPANTQWAMSPRVPKAGM